MIFLLGIYLVVGGVSAVTNFGRWLFSSWLVGILFLPFMIIYFLIYGDVKKRMEAITILKGGLVIGVFYLLTVGTIMLFQNN
jgi:heme O synthase-like polyprenyltransferase